MFTIFINNEKYYEEFNNFKEAKAELYNILDMLSVSGGGMVIIKNSSNEVVMKESVEG